MVLPSTLSNVEPGLAATSLQRTRQPSLEECYLPYTAMILPPKRAASTASTVELAGKFKESFMRGTVLDVQFNFQGGSQDIEKNLAHCKRIEFPYSLVKAGRATAPPMGDFSDLLWLFPTITGADVFPPYLIIRVKELPLKPWPLTVGGLPVHFRTDNFGETFHRGNMGRGQKFLKDLDLHRTIDYNHDVLKQAVKVFQELNIKIRDIFWFGGFWQVTVPDDLDFKLLPSFLASSPAFYRTISEAPDSDPAALKSQPPQGVAYDDTVYTTTPDALLRPGIMLSSSVRTTIKSGKPEENFKTTTSGILVADREGHTYITVATEGFEQDGLIYHPNPHTGTVIGRITETLPDTGISIAKLNTGLRYVNETFGTNAKPEGIRMSGISPAYPPRLRVYDDLSIENPFSGFCQGLTMALGARIPEVGDKDLIAHMWHLFENGEEPIDGSCGCPILDGEGRVVGLFRFKEANSSLCLSVSATELRDYGYEICGGEQIFT